VVELSAPKLVQMAAASNATKRVKGQNHMAMKKVMVAQYIAATDVQLCVKCVTADAGM